MAKRYLHNRAEEEDWSDRNLSAEGPPNPQSLETLQTPAEVLPLHSLLHPLYSERAGAAEDLVEQCPIVTLPVRMYDRLVLCSCGRKLN